MNHLFSIIPQDNFLNILNQNNLSVVNVEDDSRVEQDWRFENENNYAEEQPELQIPIVYERSRALIGHQLLSKLKKTKDEDLIKQNKDVFQANQSKSLYPNKIQQLIDNPDVVSKPKQTCQKVIVDSDSSDGKNRLARNKESARNSRKKKKIYVELLENKVKELRDKIKYLKLNLQLQKIKNQQLEARKKIMIDNQLNQMESKVFKFYKNNMVLLHKEDGLSVLNQLIY